MDPGYGVRPSSSDSKGLRALTTVTKGPDSYQTIFVPSSYHKITSRSPGSFSHSGFHTREEPQGRMSEDRRGFSLSPESSEFHKEDTEPIMSRVHSSI